MVTINSPLTADGGGHVHRQPRVRRGRQACRATRVLALLVLLGVVPAAAAAVTATTGCTLVYGHGRNVADDDAANASWDKVNHAFATEAAAAMAAQGMAVVPVMLPVVMSDLNVIVAGLLERADAVACTRIVEATLFANDDGELLVARLRAYPVLREGGKSRIGAADYTHQQEYPNTQRNRDRLVPAALGREFADTYLRRAVP